VSELDRVAVVTGGASGIGEATCRMLVARGGRVVVADLQDERGETLAAELGDAAVFQHVEVTDEKFVAAAVDEAVTRFGRLDCMFNNAGIVGAIGPVDETPVDEWDFTINVLLRSVFLGMKHAARVMKPVRSGLILSTASVAGLSGGLGANAYTAAKTAVIGLTRNVASELGAYGIRVNALAPGKIATPMIANVKTGSVDDVDETRRLLLLDTPIADRIGLPEDIAGAALWLMSDDAGYVTGQTITIDGGLTSGSKPVSAIQGGSTRYSGHQPLLREAGLRGL
jgi:NAD(P)-dependent dehydrogenase (short-subunit alcohol dehydrogenase family)